MCCSACQPIAEASSASVRKGMVITLVETAVSGRLKRMSVWGNLFSKMVLLISSLSCSVCKSSVGMATPKLFGISMVRKILGVPSGSAAIAFIA